ncbi:hypothetical protein H257_07558 [Aphanomyces astaci]|uniref:RNase H type-1 domain-containing protein n=1 Tax=Aphanomyces astaci TaxID=112090 RepID=W4GG92_APHAT|nr:hypothetical protein H257_07558 [Aphanomyces astaci]ETV78712.1 hypothetical protein H257_07558 [Aphanomyces astaci]|eukprot:XP_009831431.1 hypothetical protein H257_07558 [Aphanomyces astaci]
MACNRTTYGSLLHILETNGLTDHDTMSRPLKRLIGILNFAFQCRLVTSLPPPPLPPPGQTPLRKDGVVFFHGAARLDLASGGSGALVMQRDYPLLCDYDAHYIAGATTNIQAEYDGLLRGLQMAQTRGNTHLTYSVTANF